MGVVACVALLWCPTPAIIPIWLQAWGHPACYFLWASMFGRWIFPDALSHAWDLLKFPGRMRQFKASSLRLLLQQSAAARYCGVPQAQQDGATRLGVACSA